MLDAFGWQVVQVLAKDWLHAPEAVLEQIELALRKKGDKAGELAATTAASAPGTAA